MKNSKHLATGIFWYWNADPTPSGIRRQLKSIADAGFSCVYIHPMPDGFHKQHFFAGMKCKYLGKKYFKSVKIALEECKKLNLTLMLYDEGGWPSGSVLDTLIKKYPDCRATELILQNDGSLKKEKTTYPDQLTAKPVKRFIQMTHEIYKKELGNEFGKTIRGIFTDEPFWKTSSGTGKIRINNEIIRLIKKLHNCDFKKDILPHLLPLDTESRESRNARRIYYDVCSKLMAKHYSEQLAMWCKKNHLELEGHFSGEDEYISHGVTGNLLRLLTPVHVPGVDTIWRQIYPGKPYSFFPRLASSAAIRMKRKTVLCEAFNVYTYALTPLVMNFVANTLFIQGVNRILSMPYLYRDDGKHKICCSTDISPRVPVFDAMKTLNTFWDKAAAFDASDVTPKVWIFTQTLHPGYEIHTAEKGNVCNDLMVKLCDLLDLAGVFWRFADEDDDRQDIPLPELLIIPDPDELRADQLEVVKKWQSCGVKVVSELSETDLAEYSQVRVNKNNCCRILPCKRAEGNALMIFNPTDENTVFSFESEKRYSLLKIATGDEVYQLEQSGNNFNISLAPHGLKILIEKPSAESCRKFTCNSLTLNWRITEIETLKFSLEKKSRFQKSAVSYPLPSSGNFCDIQKDFSGRLKLECDLISDIAGKVFIEFNRIFFFARLFVNGRDCGSSAFAPYIFEVDLKKGRNRLVLKVSGSAGNEFRRCFREELEPAGYFNNYSIRFKKYSIDDSICGVSPTAFIFSEIKSY